MSSYTHEFLLKEEWLSVSLLSSSDRISFVTKDKVSGVSKNGKSWSRWRSTKELSFSYRRARRLNVYTKIREKSFQPMRFMNVSNNLPFVPEYYYDYISEFVGEELLNRQDLYRVIYPITEHYNLRGDYYGRCLPQSLTRYLREREFKTFVERAFGKTRLRKDLVKSAAQTDLYRIAYARAFRGFVPVDWMIDSMRQDTQIIPMDQEKAIRFLLPYIRPHSRRQLLLNIPRGREIHDIYMHIRWGMDVETRAKILTSNSWNQMHERLFRLVGRTNFHQISRENQVIPQTETLKAIGKISSKYTYVRPRNTDTLYNWSQDMGNCIWSYSRQAVDGKTTLFAIEKDGNMIANAEIKGGSLHQLLGKYNKHLPVDDQRAILDDLQKNNIVKNTMDCWGLDVSC